MRLDERKVFKMFKRIKYYVRGKIGLFKELYLAETIEKMEKKRQYRKFKKHMEKKGA